MYKDLLPFVNDDERALLFLRYNYIGENFSQSINQKETADTIKGEALYQLMSKQNYDGFVLQEDNLLIYDFCDKVMQNIGGWHKKINHKTVDDVYAKQIYDRVYLRWKDLSPLARKFYTTHMYLTTNDNGKDIMLRDFDNLSVYEPSNIKIHLRNAKNGNILFRETIPFLPIGAKFKTRDGTEEVIDTSNQDYMRKIYDSCNPRVGCDRIDYATTFNYSKFIQNVIRNSGKNVDLYKYVPSSDGNLDDLYPEEPELAELNFTRDADGVLVRNGEKLDDAKLEKDLKEAGICYGTGIKRTSSVNACGEVYKCLLDVKPGDVSKCAAELENEELFNVDVSTIRNINPKIMKLILQNLGVNIYKRNGIQYCDSYESWLNKTPIKQVVSKNRNLGKYISTIIDVVRTNPLILNPLQKSKNLYNLSTFKTPEGLQSNINKSDKLNGLLLYTKDVNFNPLSQVPLYPDNLRFIMSGGGEYSENAAQLKKLFDVLFDELDKADVPLVDNDKKRINDTIEKMSKLELDLPRLLEDLRVYTDLIKLIDDKEKNQTELDDFKDIRNNKSQLSDLVNKVNKKIQANINKQNIILQILYNRVQIPLIAKLVY
jgi:hypothetical protein